MIVTVVDPTQVRITATADTYVEGGASTANTNNGLTIKGPGPKPAADGSYPRTAYLGFTLPALPTGSKIISATLNVRGLITDSSFTGTDAHETTSTWSEANTTWANKPTTNPTIEGSGDLTKTAAYTPIDITNLANRKATTTTTPLNITLTQDSTPITVYINSREGNYPAYIDITYGAVTTAKKYGFRQTSEGPGDVVSRPLLLVDQSSSSSLIELVCCTCIRNSTFDLVFFNRSSRSSRDCC